MSVNFGRDTGCTDSITPGRLVTGVRLVAEAAYRRLITSRGTLRGGANEADYGLDLSELVGSVSTKTDRAALEGRIVNELTKDERIESVTATVVETDPGIASTKSFLVTVQAQTSAGPFTLQLSVTDVTVELLGLEASP